MDSLLLDPGRPRSIEEMGAGRPRTAFVPCVAPGLYPGGFHADIQSPL